jgi:hypothetical protein
MKIITSGYQLNNISDGLYLRVQRLTNRKGLPINSVQLVGNYSEIMKAHDIFFDTINGRYTPNFIGKKLGAEISSSSFTINFNTTKIKDILTYSKCDFLHIVRYSTI